MAHRRHKTAPMNKFPMPMTPRLLGNNRRRPAQPIEGVGLILPPPEVVAISAGPLHETGSSRAMPAYVISPPDTPSHWNPPLPDPGYYPQKSSVSSSPYFSPPLSSLPSHMHRGRKSVPNSKSPSMLQEFFSADNSPAYTAPSPTLGFGADNPNICYLQVVYRG